MIKMCRPEQKANICKGCKFSKDRFKESCFCTKFGYIVTYGKHKCNGYKEIKGGMTY